jgi:hypothetical protein
LDGVGVFGETGVAALRGNETGVNPIFSAAGLAGPSSVSIGLRVTDNGGLTNIATTTISITFTPPPPHQAPTGTITAPLVNSTFGAGQAIRFTGIGTDPEEGTLPASAFTWRVDFHHDGQVDPFWAEQSGRKTGTFVIPYRSLDSVHDFYRIHLTVRDSDGLTYSTFRDVLPRTSTITLQSNTPGVPLLLDGQPQTAPVHLLELEGIWHSLVASKSQAIHGITYHFLSWSDGLPRVHRFITPVPDVTLAARYYALAPNWMYQINFQPFGTAVPRGYRVDTGAVFGQRADGLSYGWNADTRSQARDFDSIRSPGQRYDTLIRMQGSLNPNAFWEIAVPNGFYQVHLVAGDPIFVDSVFKINVEGTLAINATPTKALRWHDAVVTVEVTDGRLTVSNATGAINNKINYIDIRPVTSPAAQIQARNAGLAIEVAKLEQQKKKEES